MEAARGVCDGGALVSQSEFVHGEGGCGGCEGQRMGSEGMPLAGSCSVDIVVRCHGRGGR